jgi:hypothetical protein
MNHRTFRSLALLMVFFSLVVLQQDASVTYAQVTPLGQRGCASGTVVGGPNLVFNGDFAIDPGPGPGIDPAAGYTNNLPNRGPNVYPDDPGGGGFSIQTGEKSYQDELIIGRPFPGDTSRDAMPSQTYFYSNPAWPEGVTEALLWRQDVAVTGGTTYNFFAYFDNLLSPLQGGADPVIELRVDGIVAGPAVTIPEQPDGWILIEFAFTTAPSQTNVTLEIVDLARDFIGDDFGMTQINLKQCVSGLGIAKEATFLGNNVNTGTFGVEFLITVRNFGVDPEPLRSLQIVDDLNVTFANAASFEVVELSSPTLAVNQSYDGKTDLNLLPPGTVLNAQQAAQIKIVVAVRPGPGPEGASFSNSAQGSALAGTITVSDLSTPGRNPDPGGLGNPKDADAPTPIALRALLSLPLLAR